MAYSFTNSKGTTYYLHNKKSMTSTGKERTLFLLLQGDEGRGDTDAVPAGYSVAEMKTGLPVLRIRAMDPPRRRAPSE